MTKKGVPYGSEVPRCGNRPGRLPVVPAQAFVFVSVIAFCFAIAFFASLTYPDAEKETETIIEYKSVDDVVIIVHYGKGNRDSYVGEDVIPAGFRPVGITVVGDSIIIKLDDESG